MQLAHTQTPALLDHIFTELSEERGGWLITANLDFMRRFHGDLASRELYGQADLSVADGMPLVWAAAIAGNPLPERIAGSTLLLQLVERAAVEQRKVFLLGGEPGAAQIATGVMVDAHPGLQVRHSAPMVHSPPQENELAEICRDLAQDPPDLLFVGLGSPKQETLIAALRKRFPNTWMVGVGVSFSMAAGMQKRAPLWMQKSGLEWTFRLAQEPGRLARRYLIEDIPFAAVLFGSAVVARFRSKS